MPCVSRPTHFSTVTTVSSVDARGRVGDKDNAIRTLLPFGVGEQQTGMTQIKVA